MKNKQTVLLGLGIGIGAALILLLVFFTGMYIGNKKAGAFPFWERRYSFPHDFVSGKFGHGVVGIIDSLGENSFIVKDRSGELKTILVDDQTIIRRNRSPIKFSDLKKEDKIIVIGEPQEQEGAIKARVIRVMSDFVKDASGSATPYLFPKFRRGF